MDRKPGMFQTYGDLIRACIVWGALAAILISLFVGSIANAADITVQWEPPTEYTNGQPLPLEQLDRYEFGCSNTTGVYSGDVRTWISTPTAQRVETFDTPGTYFCALRVRVLDGFGGEFSDWSNEATFIIRSRPNAPANVTVTVDTG